MSWETKCVCAGCGAIKGEANHWLLALKFNLWLSDEIQPGFFAMRPWHESAAHANDIVHLCGSGCMQKLLGEFLAPAKTVDAARATLPPLSPDERAYFPIECEFCGPRCHGGAEHNQRVENGDRYSDGGEL